MLAKKFREVSVEAIKEASTEYLDRFGEDATPENIAKRFYEIVPPRWLVATMQYPRPQVGKICMLFTVSALLTKELEPSRWRGSGATDAGPFLYYLLRGRRREQMDAIRDDRSAKTSTVVHLIEPNATEARRELNRPLRRPLFAMHAHYTRWHFYASLWYGRDLVPKDWFIAKSYRATCWDLWDDGFSQGDTGNVWGDKPWVIPGGKQ